MNYSTNQNLQFINVNVWTLNGELLEKIGQLSVITSSSTNRKKKQNIQNFHHSLNMMVFKDPSTRISKEVSEQYKK